MRCWAHPRFWPQEQAAATPAKHEGEDRASNWPQKRGLALGAEEEHRRAVETSGLQQSASKPAGLDCTGAEYPRLQKCPRKTPHSKWPLRTSLALRAASEVPEQGWHTHEPSSETTWKQ